MAVGEVDVPPDGQLQLAGAAVNAAAQLLLRQRGEPAFDQVDPRETRRREVQVKAGVAGQPAMDRGGLVGAGVVENQMHLEGNNAGWRKLPRLFFCGLTGYQNASTFSNARHARMVSRFHGAGWALRPCSF